VRGALLICKKEFLELSKDRRTLFFAFGMPLLLYPLLFSMMNKLESTDSARRIKHPSRVYLVDPSEVLAPSLKADPKNFELVGRPSGDLKQALKDQKLDLSVEVPADAKEKLDQQMTFTIQTLRDGSERSGDLALDRLKDSVATRNKLLVSSRLEALHASAQLAEPIAVTATSAADAGLQMGKILGSFLPYLLLLMMFSGSMQPGIYVTAGEKERGTLQSLLSTRLPRNQIILGKLFYVFAMGILAAVLNLLSMGFTFTRMVGPAMAANNAAHGGAPAGLPVISTMILLQSLVLMIPLGLLFANFIVFMGIQARNTHEAGTAMMPGLFVVIFLGVFSMAPGIEKMAWVPYVPVMNVSLAIRKLFSQQGDNLQCLIALAMTIALAAIMTWISTRVLDRESVIFKQS